MASSFFLCSLYFLSDSGACFIVFCHVSVIAPTACLMLSIYFVCVWMCVHVCKRVHMHVSVSVCVCGMWVCSFLYTPTRAGCEFVGQNQAAGELHRVKWQPPGHHWLMTVKTLAVNVKWETVCHSEAPRLCSALTTAQQAAPQPNSAAMQQTMQGRVISSIIHLNNLKYKVKKQQSHSYLSALSWINGFLNSGGKKGKKKNEKKLKVVVEERQWSQCAEEETVTGASQGQIKWGVSA